MTQTIINPTMGLIATWMRTENTYIADDVNFVASATGSETISLSGRTLVAIITPDSFGATSITITASLSSGGTFSPVADSTDTTITITTNATTGKWIDLTDVFPASVQFFKVVAGSSITKTIQVVSRNVA